MNAPIRRLSDPASVQLLQIRHGRSRTKQEAMKILGAAGIPAGAVFDTGDLLAEKTFEENADLSGTVRRQTAGDQTFSAPRRARRGGVWRLARDERRRCRGAEAGGVL